MNKEKAKEELKKAAGKIHDVAVEGLPSKEKTNAEKELEEEEKQKLKIQEKLATEKVKLQELENLKKLHAMAITASKTRQKLINDLIKNGTLLGDKSKNEIEQWVKKVTGRWNIDIEL